MRSSSSAAASSVCRPRPGTGRGRLVDRKSTRLNSSHLGISYAVFCLKKKNTAQETGLATVRIIHGKGNGTLRRTVHAVLERHPAVDAYQLAGTTTGTWAAPNETTKHS